MPECPFCGYLGWAHAAGADGAWDGALKPPSVAIVWRGLTARLSRSDVRLLAHGLSITPADDAGNLAGRLDLALLAREELELPLFEHDLAKLGDALDDLVRRNHETPGIAALIRLVASD